MEKTPEQLQAESQQIQSFYNAVIEEMKIQIAEMSHELALQKVMNQNKEQIIQELKKENELLTQKQPKEE